MQNDKETVTRHYIVDYLSIANRDIFVTEDGSYTTRYVYDVSGRRISAEFDYAPGTKRGEAGENLQSDIAVSIGKVFYRTSILGSTLFAVDKDGNQIAHAIYDPWGNSLTETYTDSNYSGLENLNNYTGYTYDVTLALYFAQNRFYDADTHRFTQEDTVKDGTNWYVYCGNEPVLRVDWNGNSVGILNKHLLLHDNTLGSGGGETGGTSRDRGSVDGIASEAKVETGYMERVTCDVEEQITILNANYESSLPFYGEPGSTKTLYGPDGKIKQQRKYGPDGTPEEDIDYDHGGTGHTFPHRHRWKDGKRGPAEPMPQEEIAPSKSPIEVISEMTGLTGLALILYLIISEGSRIVFPVRNLVPVP